MGGDLVHGDRGRGVGAPLVTGVLSVLTLKQRRVVKIMCWTIIMYFTEILVSNDGAIWHTLNSVLSGGNLIVTQEIGSIPTWSYLAVSNFKLSGQWSGF